MMNSPEQSLLVPLKAYGSASPMAQSARSGMPLPRGRVFDTARLQLCDASGASLPCQWRVLQRWPDRSIKWLLLDTQIRIPDANPVELSVRLVTDTAPHPTIVPLQVQSDDAGIRVDTGVACFTLVAGTSSLLSEVRLGTHTLLQPDRCRMHLLDAMGQAHTPQIQRLWLEEVGPLCATVIAQGQCQIGTQTLHLEWRLNFHAGSGRVRCEVLLHNPQAARHPGGLWDLGDEHSVCFRELSLQLCPEISVDQLRWRATPEAEWQTHSTAPWSLYQDSSGGEHWDSDNHLDRHGKLAVSFRGYRVHSGATHQLLAEGHRATPTVWLGNDCWIAASMEQFWQNFPKALRWQDGVLQLSLFPEECQTGFELQGGEQKRHVLWLEFGSAPAVPHLLAEAQLVVAPSWLEETAAVPYLVAAADTESMQYREYLASLLEGPHACLAKREIIDEYGWRNFGDLYADHEAVRHAGPRPLVSHYNNQYDFVYGSAVQFLRSGDLRWWQLCAEAARHHIDIDMYHTDQDKAAFNGGLFWHTDHYQPAATCTHRTYSGRNGGAGYGGGPSNEHNYTSGLLHYYYLSGDEQARTAVIGLAEWVLNMDDGNRTVFALLDNSPTGLASKTVSADYHHPGRGAGNSINALLDAYALSGQRRYVLKAEELLQRCIHPQDDIAALKLDEPEYRWSYLVFLQILGKYLDFKREWGELDYGYYYARDSLLHYAAWVADHELPYKQQLHKVEIPTETWPAHDVRKAHVLHVAAKYAPDSLRARYTDRAHYFQENCLRDLLSFSTAHLTRPQVILSVYGHVDAYFRQHGQDGVPYALHNYQFGVPVAFVPQRARLRQAMHHKLRLLRQELSRVVGTVVERCKAKLVRR